MVRAQISGMDCLETRRAHLRRQRYGGPHGGRRTTRWVIVGVAAAWLLVAGFALAVGG